MQAQEYSIKSKTMCKIYYICYETIFKKILVIYLLKYLNAKENYIYSNIQTV